VKTARLLVILIFEGEILDDATNNIKVLKEGASYPDSLNFTTLGGGYYGGSPTSVQAWQP